MPLDKVLATLIAEGSSEGEEGMYAIASTMVNRAVRRNQTLEQVVNAPKQFSGRWRKDLEAFVAAQGSEVLQQAQRALTRAKQAPIPDIDHYVTADLAASESRPGWIGKMKEVNRLGNHVFYDSQQPAGGRLMPTKPRADFNPRYEDILRRINRATVLAGMDPLGAQEMVGLMDKLDNPQPSGGTPALASQGAGLAGAPSQAPMTALTPRPQALGLA